MKPKHLYKRQANGTYSILRRYKHFNKKLGYVRIRQAGYEYRQPANNRLKNGRKTYATKKTNGYIMV